MSIENPLIENQSEKIGKTMEFMKTFKERGFVVIENEKELKNFNIPKGAEIENLDDGMVVYDPEKTEQRWENTYEMLTEERSKILAKDDWEHIGTIKTDAFEEDEDLYMRTKKS